MKLLWDDIVGHEVVKKSIHSAISSGKTNHAYLFSGPRGVGRSLMALATAATLNCPRGGCGECETCSRILRGVHPDVVVLEPQQKVVTMDQVRHMRLDAYRRPLECEHKVYIIRDAEKMQTETANALLKILEEPPDTVLFILLTSSPQSILPTIRSRCQILYFSLIARDKIAASLEERGVDPEEAMLLSRISGGVLGRALEWASQERRRERREAVLEAIHRLEQASLSRVMELSDELYDHVRVAVEEVATVYYHRANELDDGSLDSKAAQRAVKDLGQKSKQEQAKAEVEGIGEVFMMMASWYRDILVLSEGADESLVINVDRLKDLRTEARAVGAERALACIQVIREAQRAVARNADRRTSLERTLFGIQEVICA